MQRESSGRRAWGLAMGGILRALPGLAPTVLVIALLACMLLPLPTVVVDLLLSVSLASAVLLLVAALVIRRTTEFLSFPILLLIVTLFRLALNVSTTRLILSQANAGKVIEAFAGVVARDDLLVGAVMFAIITLVQYLVIARGSERVAEVAARFALDGLPGHQAAIDADLRAKTISAREATNRRAGLTQRSNFYGAMDGAMRFVKGDAIAGLAITAVNLVGGIVIGTTRFGYQAIESLELYGRLSIGDGLLAQIPALLVSLAAGILVSRVDREDDRPPSLSAWLDPPMLLVPAVFLLVVAVVPGMPRAAFVVTAVALTGSAFAFTARAELRRPRLLDDEGDRLIVRIAADGSDDLRSVERTLSEVRVRCANSLRTNLPDIAVERRAGLTRRQMDVLLGERRLTRVDMPAGREREEAMVLALFRAIMDNAEVFIDLEKLGRMIDDLRLRQPLVVERMVSRVTMVELLALVRGLLRERIPMPSMIALAASLAEYPLPEDIGRPDELRELVRQRLAAWWLPELLDGLSGTRTRWVRFGCDDEDELCESVIRGSLGVTLNLTHEQRVRWVARVVGEGASSKLEGSGAQVGHSAGPVVMLASNRARGVLAELLRGATPHVPVVSVAEFWAAGLSLPVDVEQLA